MNDPIKIIWKFKNKNRRTQYNIYIYIGHIHHGLDAIYNKIENLSLYDTLINLTNNEYNKMEKIYGVNWYLKFFNINHIKFTFNLIQESKTYQKELENKYGNSWVKLHILTPSLTKKNIIYSYESIIQAEYDKKNAKNKYRELGISDYENINFYIQDKIHTGGHTGGHPGGHTGGHPGGYPGGHPSGHTGGNDVNVEGIEDIDNYGYDDNLQNDISEEDELMDIKDLYKDTDVINDDNITKTNSLIKKAINDESFIDRKYTDLIDFNMSENDSTLDADLKDVYKKCYVRKQYIYKDDTIKRIKEKISCSLKNNNVFGENSVVLPSRQYLWSEYIFNGKKEKLMIGQKWMRRNIILPIDIEPNQLVYYEDLYGNIKILDEILKRHTLKIRYEDDANNIYYDYDEYITNNEIYMIDIYNELGVSYNPNQTVLQNIQNTYIKIYFPKIKEEIKHIISYLNNTSDIEAKKISSNYEIMYNDLIIDNEIMNLVDETQIHNKIGSIFKERYITHAVIHLLLRYDKSSKLDLRRIFDNFITDSVYPFIQYQTSDKNIYFKINEGEIKEYAKEKLYILHKWFENAPYGLSFKINITGGKFMVINLLESGKMEYKTQWKEDDMANNDSIKKTYIHVKDLIIKLNAYKNNIYIKIPDDNEFKYAFLNTIQRFELPDNYIINHNDLSDFCIYFYPYISLIIDPPKRTAKDNKINNKSKFGTYLKYKRVSKYDNHVKIEQRILYFLKNYDFSDQTLAIELSKQFNILEERAQEEIKKTRAKYNSLKKSRKVLKKLENIPKYKQPGIEIDIQGKQREKYKIRISGARDDNQMNRMLTFMNVLLYLYIETYILKIPERVQLKNKLSTIQNIAKRRNKVDTVVNYVKEQLMVKKITNTDKTRLGYKPAKGQEQWSRLCQNSGKKKRRPMATSDKNIINLQKMGYKYNKKTDNFEKEIIVKQSGKKVKTVLKSIKLPQLDNEMKHTGNNVYYTCDPQDNGEYSYVGFLTKSLNPNGFCLPCCYKKNILLTKNKAKTKFFNKCMNQESIKIENTTVGEILYILHDTNKVQEGRLSVLPKHMDIYLNTLLKRNAKMKNNYLLSSLTGYFYKMGVKTDEPYFLNCISLVLDLTIDKIKNKLIESLKNDKDNILFISLLNGEICNQFKTIDNYINYIKDSIIIEPIYIIDLLSVPGVIFDNGLNIIIFVKKTINIKHDLEKDKSINDFNMECYNFENYGYINDIKRKNIILLHDEKIYYPIIEIKKIDVKDRNIDINKIFSYEPEKTNIINHISDFYNKNCVGIFTDEIMKNKIAPPAKMLKLLLDELDDKYEIKYQLIDSYNKCKYLITKNNTIIPTRPSGTINNIKIITNLSKYISDFNNTYKKILDINTKSKGKIIINPISVYYDKHNNNVYNVISIITDTADDIPIIPTKINVKTLNKLKLTYKNMQIGNIVDNYIIKDELIIDERIKAMQYEKYKDESYELYRYEFSNYINNHVNIKNFIVRIINSSKTKADKHFQIKALIFRLINTDIYNEFINTYKNKSDILDSDKEIYIKEHDFMEIQNNEPEYINYNVNNVRLLCSDVDKYKCSNIIQCTWNKKCKFSLPKKFVIIFTEKITEELLQDSIYTKELLQVDNYKVSDIIDASRFTELPGQKIFKSNTFNIKQLIDGLFGKNNTPNIGRKKTNRIQEESIIEEFNKKYTLVETNNLYIQKILDNNMSLFRAYANSYYYYRKHENLGYYSTLQTELANYFRSIVTEWLDDEYNVLPKEIRALINIPISDYIIQLVKNIEKNTACIPELYILNKVLEIPIHVFNNENKVMNILDDNKNKKTNKYIGIKFIFHNNSQIPKEIYSVYYK